MWTRFFTVFGSGTPTKTSLRSGASGSPEADIQKNSSPRWLCQPSTALQNEATRSGSEQSTQLWVRELVTLLCLLGPTSSRGRRRGRRRAPERDVVDVALEHGDALVP